MEKFFRVITIFFTSLSILAISCGKKKGPTESLPITDETIISKNTIVADEEDNLTLDNVTESSISYSFTGSTPDISVGDILVSKEGNGYLRKVKSKTIEGNKITINTENATLTDAVVKGKFAEIIKLELKEEKIDKSISILKSAKGVSISEDGIDLSGVVLFSGNVGGNDLTVNITKGSISFEPDLDIGGELDEQKVLEFHAIAQGEIKFDLDLNASTSGEIDYKEEINLITIGYIAFQLILGFPVMEVITLEFNAGFEALGNAEGNLKTGIDHTTQIRVGAQYKSGKWSPVWPEKPEGKAHDTDWSGTADLNIIAYVKPCISVKLYSVAGPYLDAKPFLGFNGDVGGEYAWFWELKGGIESKLGFDVSVLGYEIANYSKELLALETVIDSDFEEFPSGYCFIPAGSFEMGDNFNEGDSDELPVHTVYLDAYYIGKYEVTNAEYKKFMDNGGYTNESYWTAGGFGNYRGQPYWWDNSTYRGGGIAGNENFPVVGVGWYEANSYCKWLSEKTGKTYRLPTEAEWDKAARGTGQLRYPCGNSIDGSYANYWGSGDPFDNGLTPVGYYDGTVHGSFFTLDNSSPYGAYDMAGNVCEWCSDWYNSNYYSVSPTHNPKGPSSGTFRVYRGGGWYYDFPSSIRSANRYYRGLHSVHYNLGFRCARDN